MATRKNKSALIICIQETREDGSSMDVGSNLTEEDITFLHQAFIADSINNALSLPRVDIKLFYSPNPQTQKSIKTILEYLKGRLKGRKKAENRAAV